MLRIRAARAGDRDGIWAVLEPVMRAGETYLLARDARREDVLGFWFAGGHEVFVAEEEGGIVGTYFLRANQGGGGSHVANCGYVTATKATGRGVASAMCTHSLERARAEGFRGMQYNFVVSTNERAVRLWKKHGFRIVGQLPGAFLHPLAGYVDAYVMYREL
jgi:ribosomal protein S18 acetylase RimI-like enzyme